MVYAIFYYRADIDREVRKDVKGTPSLEKFTDSRILSIHKNAIRIYKVYGDSTAIILKGDCC